MSQIHPFAAWRPQPGLVEEIACVPYDVIDTDEARELSTGKANSFLHIIRPEIDLPEDTGLYDDIVYNTGAKNLQSMITKGLLVQEETPSLYIYRLIMNGRSQTGLFACVSVEDYDNDVILKHELTRPDKEDDRTRHIITQQAHAEPVMLTYRDDENINQMTDEIVGNEDPLYDFTASDGIQHTIWKVGNPEAFVESFAGIDHLYVADGHHRCKSASRTVEEMKKKNKNHTGNEEYNFFPAVLFPMGQMKILAYNRIIFHLPDSFMDDLSKVMSLREDAKPVPSRKGDISIYYRGKWFGASLPETVSGANSAEKLDVSRLQQYILEPLLNITDQRRDKNISFVGGIRGTKELERLVDSGKAKLAISMYPTEISELLSVSDEGLLMPPKSTWFEPKLRSGLLVHTF